MWGLPVILDRVPTDPINTDTSTQDTIQRMIGLAKTASLSPVIASVVDSCLASLPPHPSTKDLTRSLFLWIKGHVEFVEDEDILREIGQVDMFQELLIAPTVLITMPHPQGDCDDFSMLGAALLLAAGIHCRFTTIALEEIEPNRFSHVYVGAWIPEESSWIGFDSSHGNRLGWEKNGWFRRLDWVVG